MGEFTPEQNQELDDRAEKRDLRRPRLSRFSVGEQDMLDKTARDLERQVKDTAWDLRSHAIKTAKDLEVRVDLTARNLEEQAEQKAKELDFNDLQQARLDHRSNEREAQDLTRRFRRRALGVLAAFIVTAGFIVDVAWQQAQTDQTRGAIVVLCQQQRGSCQNLFK